MHRLAALNGSYCLDDKMVTPESNYFLVPGADSGGVLGVHGPPPLGLHRNIDQYVYYPAVVHFKCLYCTIDNFIYKCGDSAY